MEVNTYEVFIASGDILGQLHIVKAAYFVADSVGVMFFDKDNKGIGFVPTDALCLIRKLEEKGITIRGTVE